MKRKRERTKLREEMNFTNLVDVIFAILVVFMVTAPMMTKGVSVELPRTEAPAMKTDKLLTISVDKDRRIFVEKQETTLAAFATNFKASWDGQSPVVVNADAAVPYGWVMKIVSRAQALGVVKIGFLTRGGLPEDQ